MEIYIGGYAQGKTAYIKEKYPDKQVTDAEQATLQICEQAQILNHFHCFIRTFGADEEAAMHAAMQIAEKNPDLILLCDEVGNGIIPLEQSERDYRELVGRVMCAMTARAQKVVRIVCGIGIQIK